MRSMLGKTVALAGRNPSFIALADQGVVSATTFATGVIIGRVCGKAELGVYALVWTLIALTTEISAVLTTTPYTVFSPRLGRYQRSRYLGSVLVHQLFLSLMFALTMLAGAALGSWRGWLPNNISSAVTTTAAVIVFIGLREFVRRVSFAELKVGTALLIDVIACLVQTGGLLLLVHFGVLSVSRSYALLGISFALVAGGWLTLRWGAVRPGTRLYGRDLTRNWRFAKWVLGSCILSLFARYLYPWVLAAFHGTSVTGLWAACAAIVALGNPVVLGLGNHVLPNISTVYASSGTAAMRRQVNRSSLQFAAFLMPIVLILAVWGERIVTGVYGKAYGSSAAIVLLLAVNMLISSLMFPYSQGLFSLERAKADTLVNVVTVALLFTIGIAAIKSYAALGAAAALLVTSGVTALIRVGVFAHEIRQRAPEGPPDPRYLAVESPK
jgi:O-antigen/teichoic acid export membrane protein